MRTHSTQGLAANIERERQFIGTVKEWRGFAVTARGDVNFYECARKFIATDGAKVHTEQVSVAKWEDGKIVQEWFYYDTGART